MLRENDSNCGIDRRLDCISVGIVGAGRSRNGLGPFLAGFLETTGFLVTGVSGRSFGRARANAEEVGRRLGHEVCALPSLEALCGSGISALVIAAPAEHHLEALQAAAETGLPTLCEKPLLHENDIREGPSIINSYASRCLPLMENCQWPYLLPVFVQLNGEIHAGEVHTVEMGLGPPRPGREMVQGTLSHLLSIAQVFTSIDSKTIVRDVRLEDPKLSGTQNTLCFDLAGPARTISCVLHLSICDAPPRPAWLLINGRRIDRRILQGHSMTFAANGIEIAVADPVKALVRRFELLVRNLNPVLMDLERGLVGQRLEWYRQVLEEI